MKNKTITIYELMGLIKDNKAPKKIKIHQEIYEMIGSRYYINKEFTVDNDLFYKITLGYVTLDDTVEIVPEENDEWEDIEKIKLIDTSIEFYDDDKVRHLMNTNAKDRNIYIAKINQLIKNQRKIIEKLEEK